MVLARRICHNPWDAMREFRSELDRMLGTHTEGDSDTATNWVPPIDIQEGDTAYEVSADLPGVDPKDIEVSLEGGVLTIQGHRESENQDEGQGYTRTERFYGSFFRRFTLPDTADGENISARTEHGVLKLHVPKKEKALPKKITVQG